MKWKLFGPLFDPNNTPSGEGNTKAEETKKEETKKEETPKSEKRKFKYGDEILELDDAEVDALLAEGINAYVSRTTKKEETKKEEIKKEEIDPQEARIQKLEKDLAEARDAIIQDRTKAQNERVERDIDRALGDLDFIDKKDDSYQMVRDLIMVEAHRDKRAKVEDIAKKVADKFKGVITKTKTEYVKKKQETLKSTKGLGIGAPGGLEKPKPVTSDEFMKGGTHRQVKKFLDERKRIMQ